MIEHKPPYTVLVIDDHPLFRKGAEQLIKLDPEFRLIGEATNGKDGIDMYPQLQPDLVLLDLNMQDIDGISVLKKLKQNQHKAIIIILTVSDSEYDIVAALQNGADGYLLKDMEPEEILVKLHHAVEGQTVIDESVSAQLASALRNESRVPPVDQVGFTNREAQIVLLIAEGNSNKAIARELGISDGTVKVHVKNVLRKVNLSTRLEIAVWAFEHDYPNQYKKQRTLA
jgi:two-component system nitrate/nitrite response regulator NarL